MDTLKFKNSISSYQDFPKKGILFRDISPIFADPILYGELINEFSKLDILLNAEAIVAIDARGFFFFSSLATKCSMPFIVARKPGKLPGNLISKNYSLEYGENSLSINKDLLSKFKTFVIIDDLLATGGTAKCVGDILMSEGKKVTGLAVVVELEILKGSKILPFPVSEIIRY